MQIFPFFQDKKNLEHFCNRYDIRYLGLFGSHARSEQKEDSDVDILVDFVKTPSFFELFDIENTISKELNKKVDLVTLNSLSKHIKPYIMNDLVNLYEKS